MRNLKQLIISVSLLFAVAFSANAGQDVAKTMPLGDGITTSGIVKLVVKLTDDAVGPDVGITLHEGEVAAPWNDAMAISMFDFIKNESGAIQLAGYNGADAWDWATNIKTVEKNKQIALWISVDAENHTHGLSAQVEGETTVTTVFADYADRASIKGQPATNAKYCSVFVNNRDGQATSAIEVIVDAAVVDAIEPHTFAGGGEGGASIAQTAFDASIKVSPSVASTVINIESAKAISTVSIMTLNGVEVASAINTDQVDVAAIEAGIYLVKVTSIDGEVAIRKIVKE